MSAFEYASTVFMCQMIGGLIGMVGGVTFAIVAMFFGWRP